MSETQAFGLIIFTGALPIGLLIIYLLFKNTITFLIGLSVGINVTIISFISFFVGHNGLDNLKWAIPYSMSILFITFYYINKKLGVPLKQLSKNLELVADGELSIVIDKKHLKYKNEIGVVSKSMLRMVDKLTSIVKNVRSSSSVLANVSEELNKNAQNMSEVASEQAASFEEVTGEMDQIVNKIQLTNKNTRIAEETFSKSTDKIKISNAKVQETLSILQDISEKINVINDIAFETNILSLNASIESSRAGVYGKSFSVVAREVRNLSERSKNSAIEISEVSQKSTKIADETSRISTSIIPDIQKSLNMLKEVSYHTNEQEQNATQINLTFTELNNSVQQLSGSSEELTASSEELTKQALHLRETMEYFKLS